MTANARFLRLVALMLLALLASGCSVSPSVETDYNPEYDFSRAHSFAIVEPTAVSNSVAVGSDDILHNRIREALASALTARGFRIAPAAQADMLVSFLVTTENKTAIRSYNTGIDYYRCWRCGGYFGGFGAGLDTIDVDQYTEGTLFVDFIDPQSKQLQWRGAVTKRLSKTRSIEERKQLVSEVVNQIVAQFPPGP